MKAKIPFDVEALYAAYEICHLMSEHSANVIASGDPANSDVENKKKADKFIKAYKRTIKLLQNEIK
jgi:hypothetical protein